MTDQVAVVLAALLARGCACLRCCHKLCASLVFFVLSVVLCAVLELELQCMFELPKRLNTDQIETQS